MRERIKCHGSQSIVYVDESGFAGGVVREYGWAARGKKVYGDRLGKRQQRTSLLLAQAGTKRFSPLLFEGSCNTLWFNAWLKDCLLPELKPKQTVVMDHAAIHKNQATKELLEEAGCHLLFLPPYSPDFNPIEKTFGSLKKKRPLMPAGTTLDDLVCSIL